MTSLVKIHEDFKSMVEGSVSASVVFENESGKFKLGESHAVFELGAVSTARQGQGVCEALTYSGEVSLEIKTDIKTGALEAFGLADKLISAIMTMGTSDSITFVETPYTGGSSQSFDWFSVFVLIPFKAD